MVAKWPKQPDPLSSASFYICVASDGSVPARYGNGNLWEKLILLREQVFILTRPAYSPIGPSECGILTKHGAVYSPHLVPKFC